MIAGALALEVLSAAADVPAAAWDACAGERNPFVSHAFLSALEDSGVVTRQTGWEPRHLVARQDGRLVGALPLYLKTDSMGEYMFDYAWAQAYTQLGGAYYPKLQVAVPFTPVPGPRLLVRRDCDQSLVRQALINELLQLARAWDVSSAHLTFCQFQDCQALARLGFLQRTGLQYHWSNRGYDTFEDFLSALTSRKRKSIRRERREACAHGLRLQTLQGEEIAERHWDALYHCYLATADRKWGRAYLNRRFFSLLGQRLSNRVVLMLASRSDKTVAAAWNLLGSDTLFGRNWGCLEDYPFLHFELCYYRALEFAISHGLETVQAGAQGRHKIQRGYMPVATYGAAWFADARFGRLLEAHLDDENRDTSEQVRLLAQLAPYRKAP